MTTPAPAGPPPALDLAFGLQAGGEAPPRGCVLVDPGLAEGRWSAHLAAWLGQLQPELPARLQAPGYSLGLELCDDAAIAELNRSWRQMTGPTDVLAFAAQEGAPPLPPAATDDDEAWLELGDIVISLDTARRQADAAGHTLEQELLFLASHGLLHLLGWDHPDEASLAVMLGRQATLLEACPP
ncbi:MAG: rRNA maturation factor [Cyanobium sp. CACIAM 14]|nr:MAG: rRNA maturation factor [Cyanobium sp. CACIAM 14]